MRITNLKQAWLPMLGIAVIFSACQKNDLSSEATPDTNQKDQWKLSGVAPDDPAKVAQVPLLISSGYNVTEAYAARGPKKGNGGNTGGGTTGGTTDTTTTSTGGTTGGTSGGTTTLPPTTNLPSSYALNMPPVGVQGSEFSCAVFAIGYAARSAEQLYKTGASSYSYGSNIFSPEYLYNQTKFSSDCGSGTSIVTALEFLKTNGICTWQSMPYSYTNGCSLMPTGTQSAEAANYRIASYSKIISSDKTAIKTMVANNHPVIITSNIDQAFMNAQPGFVWRSYATSPSISHAMVICGYDDARNAYKVMNSWGTGWGDAGYSWIDYDFFPQASFYYSYAIGL